MNHVGQLRGINCVRWGSVGDRNPNSTFSPVLTDSESRVGSGWLGFDKLQNSHGLGSGSRRRSQTSAAEAPESP